MDYLPKCHWCNSEEHISDVCKHRREAVFIIDGRGGSDSVCTDFLFESDEERIREANKKLSQYNVIMRARFSDIIDLPFSSEVAQERLRQVFGPIKVFKKWDLLKKTWHKVSSAIGEKPIPEDKDGDDVNSVIGVGTVSVGGMGPPGNYVNPEFKGQGSDRVAHAKAFAAVWEHDRIAAQKYYDRGMVPTHAFNYMKKEHGVVLKTGDGVLETARRAMTEALADIHTEKAVEEKKERAAHPNRELGKIVVAAERLNYSELAEAKRLIKEKMAEMEEWGCHQVHIPYYAAKQKAEGQKRVMFAIQNPPSQPNKEDPPVARNWEDYLQRMNVIPEPEGVLARNEVIKTYLDKVEKKKKRLVKMRAKELAPLKKKFSEGHSD